MNIYEAKIQEDKDYFTTAIVKNPAVEEKLIYFNEEKPLFFASDEKRIIYSVAMRPNKLIYRNDIYGEPAKVFFSEETIEQFQQKYAKHFGQKRTNINHTDNYVNDVYPIENWIVKDPEIDKAKVIGLPVIKGDLVMAFKVENDEVWEQCKKGELDGLSIESYLDYIEINNEKKQEMKKQTFWEAFKSMLKVFATENNTMTISVEGKDWNVTELAVDGVVTDTDGNPLSDGAFEYEGNKYETNGMGVITEVSAVEEEMSEEPKEEEPKEEEEMAEDAPDLQAENDDLKAKVAELEKQLTDIEAKKVEAETQLEQMKKETPKAQFISDMPKVVQKPYEQMTNLEKAKFNRGLL
jgi:hypothetical protein